MTKFNFVQNWFDNKVETVLSKKLKTEVKVEHVSLGLFNRVILHNVLIKDQEKEILLKAKTLSAKIELRSIFAEQLVIRTINILDADINIYKSSEKSDYNFKFILDSFSSKKKEKESSLNIGVNSLIIRRVNLDYNRRYIQRKDKQFDFNHLSFSSINANLSLKTLRKDSLQLRVRNLSLKESCGFYLKHLKFIASYGSSGFNLKNFSLELPNSFIDVNSVTFLTKKGNNGLLSQIKNLKFEENKIYITPSDLKYFFPKFQHFNNKFFVNLNISTLKDTLFFSKMGVLSTAEGLNFNAKGKISHYDIKNRIFNFQLENLYLSSQLMNKFSKHLLSKEKELPFSLPSVDLTGDINGVQKNLQIQLNANLLNGNSILKFHLSEENKLAYDIQLRDINLSRFTNRKIKNITGILNGSLLLSKDLTGTIKSNFKELNLLDYTYKSLAINASLKKNKLDFNLLVNDSNFNAQLNIIDHNIKKKQRNTSLVLNLHKLNPKAVHFTDIYQDASISSHLSINVKGANMDNTYGSLKVKDFSINNTNFPYHLNSLELISTRDKNERKIQMTSDFLDFQLIGKYKLKNILQSLYNKLHSYLPSFKIEKYRKVNNQFHFNLQLKKTDFFQKVCLLPIEKEGDCFINADLNDQNDRVLFTSLINHLKYKQHEFKNITFYCKNNHQKIDLLIKGDKRMKHGFTKAVISFSALNDSIFSKIDWAYTDPLKSSGSVSLCSNIKKNQEIFDATVKIKPSFFYINDTIWHVSNSALNYNQKKLEVNHLKFSSKDKYLTVNGNISKSLNDTLKIGLRDLDVSYILDAVKFDDVKFSGFANGTASLVDIMGDVQLEADLLVNKFNFNDADMGTLKATAKWDNILKQINLNARIYEPLSNTIVSGYVSPSHNKLDLNFNANSINISFVHYFLQDIFKEFEGRGTGDCRLFGDLKKLNLEGNLNVDLNAKIAINNVAYHLKNNVVLSPNSIKFNNIDVIDKHNNHGLFNGEVLHDCLHRFRYKMNLKTNQLLCYDFTSSQTLPFYGTVFADAEVNINGGPGTFNCDINVTPTKNSTFVYNAAKPSEIDNKQLLEFNDVTKEKSLEEKEFSEKENISIKNETSSDIFLNLIINANPNVDFKILMDENKGDNILFHGDGTLRASFYNKGKFNLFGTYNIVDGVYDMSLQEILHRRFHFKPNSTLSFKGDPDKGDIDWHAVYTVNSASLSDLNMNENFGDKMVRADCLLNIKGTVSAPQVSFDLDLPTTSAEERNMVKNLINSEEDMNMQIIYLLSFGRFYTYDYASTKLSESGSQSSLAVSSLLSSSLSTQLSNMLFKAINSDKWMFGTNVNTGSINNEMEVEGLFTGHLLNNRLLINGNFGYRGNTAYSTNFVGDFDVQYRLTPNGNVSLKAYSETNDRYFTKSSLTTQGVGIIFKKDFSNFFELFNLK